MNLKEAAQILSVLKAAYPNSYQGMKDDDIDVAIKLWARTFKDKPYPDVAMAVDAIICTNITNFTPSLGEVMARIIKNATGPDMTEMEAWELVYKAIKNSAWHAQEEFSKLPPTLQQCVGSPEMLQSWAGMPADTVQSVIQSNFMRTFKSRKATDYEQQALPEAVRAKILKLSEGIGA